MTTATTKQAIRRELLERLPELGFSGVADSVAVTSITDAFRFQNSNQSTKEFSGSYLYRPDLSGDDTIKVATTVSTAALSHSGSNYADTADTSYELHRLLHPLEMNACIERSTERIYFTTYLPLTLVADGDMEASNTTSWTGSSGTTLSKVTTANKVFSGSRALRIQNDSANDYAESGVIPVFPGERFFCSAVVKADVGTAVLNVYDSSNTASIGTSVESAEEGFTRIWQIGVVPTGCEEITIRLTGEESTADLYWSHVVFYRETQKVLNVPSWLDDPWKLYSVREARYKTRLSSQTSGGYDDATSRTWYDWKQILHYEFTAAHTEANPYSLEFMRPLPDNEMWVYGKRPYSDVEDLSTEASTTRAPLRLVYAYAMDEIAKVLRRKYPNDTRWKDLLRMTETEIEKETVSRADPSIRRYRKPYSGRI